MLTKKYKDIIELLVNKLGDALFKKQPRQVTLKQTIDKSPSLVAKDMIPLSENKVAIEKDIVTSILNNQPTENSQVNLHSEEKSNLNYSSLKSKGLIERINTNTNNKNSMAELNKIELPNINRRQYVKEEE